MKKLSLTGFAGATLLMASVSVPTAAYANWEMLYQHPTCQAHFITSKGTHLMSDFRDDLKGGIYFSADKGKTWAKTGARDYNYHKFYEADGYIYALGVSGRIARSENDGISWEILNYTNSLQGVIEDKALQAVEAYGIVKEGNRLYIGDFAGGGVLYSEDNGESWKLTDRESLFVNISGVGKTIDSYYNLVSFKGYIYAFGALSVSRYDAAADKWQQLPLNSNFMAVSTIYKDRLVCGRSNPNFDETVEYLLWTDDGETWNKIDAPAPLHPYGVSRNVRAILADGDYIFTTGPDGVSFNPPGSEKELELAPEFFYTYDFGEHWCHAEGLPRLSYPLTLAADDEYIYASVFMPNMTDKDSGIWRLAKKELATASVDSMLAEDALSVRVSGGRLAVSAVAESIEVFDLSGKLVTSAADASGLDVSGLESGVYIYSVNSASEHVSGKFVK